MNERKFLCDTMCQDLGRWLRTAGYDTVIIETSLEDQKILQMAKNQNRLLLTRDRQFLQLDPEKKVIIFLQGESLNEWTRQLKEEKQVDWLYNPFNRCLECNTVLEKTKEPGNLSEKIKENVKEFWSCPTCHQIFWLGSHTERMRATLKKWQNELMIGLGGDLMVGRLVNTWLENHPPSSIWGDLSSVLSHMDLNIVNLETTLTNSQKIRPKVFNFKSHPKNVAVLTEGHIDAVNIANNHILDFSEEGLLETIQTLDAAKIGYVGAGKDISQAQAPVIIERNGITIGILGCSDNEPSWKAEKNHPGINFVAIGNTEPLRDSILQLRKQVDLVLLSMHWGPNMQRRPKPAFRAFAHDLIDLGVDILHGHSAHVFQGVEIYHQKLILYDTGDLVDDYTVDPLLRNDLSFYFVIKAAKDKLLSLEMIPTIISDYQVNLFHQEQSLNEMETLCKELGSHPVRKKDRLFFSI